jgi:hypothetical protein
VKLQVRVGIGEKRVGGGTCSNTTQQTCWSLAS